MNKTRLEAFSDGVLAIIITIMVLELKPPHGGTLSDLKPLLPYLFAYFQSFWFVGVYWNNHHHLFHSIKKTNSYMMVANMNLLFWLSLVPFVTEWVGESNFQPLAVAVYALLLVICGFAWTILQSIIKNSNQWSEAMKMAMQRQRRKGILSTVLYSSGLPLAFVNPFISEVLFLFVACMWLIPDRHIENILSGE